MSMTRIFRLFSLAVFIASMPHAAGAWDHTTSNPCDTPVAHTPDVDVSHHADNVAKENFSATVDLNLPLSSKINTKSYNADLSASEIDAGTALVTQDGAYVNVLGNEVTPQEPQPPVESSASASATCR